MTTAELHARAIQRAHDEHVHIFKVPNRPGVYTTLSKSRPRARYVLVVEDDGTVGCSCRGFLNHKACKHAEGLLNRLARERTEANARPRRKRAEPALQAPLPLTLDAAAGGPGDSEIRTAA